jgi:uncharacterized membrane protein YdjX (TVP38/TMEM64 family)
MKSDFRDCSGKRNPSTLIRRILTSPGVGCIVLVIIAAWIAQHYLGAIGGAEAMRARLGLSALLPLIVVHGLVSVSPLPGEVVAFANSMVFGFALGVVANWSGWMLGAIIEYRLVQKTTSDLGLNRPALWSSMPKWLQSLPVHHPMFLICSRWLPFGCHIANTAAGAAGVPLWRHLWCSAIGILPLAVIVAALGSGAAGMMSGG